MNTREEIAPDIYKTCIYDAKLSGLLFNKELGILESRFHNKHYETDYLCSLNVFFDGFSKINIALVRDKV